MIKKLDAPLIEARYGFYGEGGGSDRRVALADTFGGGPLRILAAVQYDSVQAIWGYQRSLTSSYNRSYPATEATPYNVFNYNVYGRAFYLGAQYSLRQ